MTSPLRPVESQPDLEAALAPFRAARSLLLIGGADFADADPQVVEGIRGFLETLARHCERTGTAVIDGGTDAGVMRWFADARAAVGGTFPLVGVAPAFAFERPTRAGRAVAVAVGHSVVVAVPGTEFGDELPWLFAAADGLGIDGPAPTVLVNGGEGAAAEARARLADGHMVVAVAGSGRAADDLANRALGNGTLGNGTLGSGANGTLASQWEAPELRGSGRLRVIPLSADESILAAALEEPWTE